MANEEQLSILKQGVDVWNKWRHENPKSEVDLVMAELDGANLSGANLNKADFSYAYLSGADLSGADLEQADLTGTNLWRAYLSGVNFSNADLNSAVLQETILWKANLNRVNLSKADLKWANFSEAELRYADLREADLRRANFDGADLQESDLSNGIAYLTIFGNVDLSATHGLERIIHKGPSTIGTDTITLSKGKIPEIFLRGCGLSDWEIEQVKLYNPDLSKNEFIDIQNRIFDLRNGQAIQISPLFISYSHSDSTFVNKLERQLNNKGIRFWRDIHDMKAGRIETQIDRAITQNRTVLLVLSEHSIKSDWVEHEVRTARGLEKDMGRDVLCPVALDDSWKNSKWEKRVMEQIMKYNILDFSAWEDDVRFEGMFRKLIDGLELFYKG